MSELETLRAWAETHKPEGWALLRTVPDMLLFNGGICGHVNYRFSATGQVQFACNHYQTFDTVRIILTFAEQLEAERVRVTQPAS